MRSVLVHLELSPALESVLACALHVGRAFGSYLEGLHVRPGQPDIIAAGADGFVAAAPDLVAGFERESRERADRARAVFEEFLARHGLPRPGPPGGGDVSGPANVATADWRAETGSADAVLGGRGRVFDLILVGRPLPDAMAPSMAALETALFEAGRPLLIAPPRPPERLGERVAIAWNGSTETARAVAFSMPFLERASHVTVVGVQGGTVQGPTAAELADNLRRHGLPVALRDAPLAGRSIGQAMLQEAAAAGADLVVKGAYTQSRLRQMIFGGATSHFLAHAEVPVLMAN